MFLTIILYFFTSNNLRATDINIPGTPYSINCIDFDLDGDVDIVVGCNSYEGDTIAIFFNDGYGNFEVLYHPKANNLFYTQCADMNGDGLPDVITINDDLKYGYYTNLGNGSLGEWHYIIDFTGEKLTEVMDFDNNGFNDLLYYQNINPGKWGIVYNFGNNSFINQIQFSCTENITSICSGYLNEDTLRDVLIVSPDLSLGSKVFYNNGNSFIQSNDSLPRSLQGFIVDINNDNINDIALNHISNNSFLQLVENISGGFSIIDTIELPDQSTVCGFPDLNNDSYPDIFHRASMPSIGFDEIYVSYNNLNWGFLSPHNYIIGEPSMPITQNYGDLNGDGYIDFVLANYLPGRLMKILWNDGTGQFVINNPVFLDENKNQVVTHFEVYPNPFSDELNISIISEHVNTVRLRISDIMGRDACKPENVKLTNGDNTINVNLPELPKGIYFYALNIDNRIIHTGKIIKE
jgi:hypothetical protein